MQRASRKRGLPPSRGPAASRRLLTRPLSAPAAAPARPPQEAFKVFQSQVLSERSLRGIEALIAELEAVPDAPGGAGAGECIEIGDD